MKRITALSLASTVTVLAVRALAAATSVFGGSAVLDQATRATLSKNEAAEARFSSSYASAVLDWSKLNVPKGSTLGFDGSGTTFFNLVSATAGKSQIDGLVNGDGSVWVINPSGIAFGATAQVNVGGLFAAAAGNLSNEAAIRDGTATLPAFSAFAGSVAVDSAATFTADQVALLGKSVSAAGDMTYVNALTVGAADKMVVDEVAGGRISVSVSDFATEGAAELGDLLVGGDVKAAAHGDVTANGEAYAGGDIALHAQAGDVTVAPGAIVDAWGSVSLATRNGDIRVGKNAYVVSAGDFTSVTAYTGVDGEKGDIVIDGTLAADGIYGTVDVIAGKTEGATGSVTLNGRVSSDYYSELAARTGDITVNGTVTSLGDVTLNNESGAITVAKGAVVSAEGGSQGTAYDIYFGYASDKTHGVGIYGAMGAGGTSAVTVDGTVSAAGEKGYVRIEAGYNPSTGKLSGGTGGVTVGGTLSATERLVARAYGDLILDGGALASDDWISLSAYYGSAALGSGTLTAGGDIAIDSFKGVSGTGAITAKDGTLTVDGGIGDIALSGRVQAKNVGLDASTYMSLGYIGDVTMDNPLNDVTGMFSAYGYDVDIVTAGALTFGNTLAYRKLAVSAGGPIAQVTGTKIYNRWSSSSATFTSAGDILLGNTGNDFYQLGVVGKDVTVNDASGIRLLDSTVSGDLAVTSSGTIAQAADTGIACAGRATFDSTGSDVVLGNWQNAWNDVAAEGDNVLVFAADGVTLGDVTARSGDVTVSTATGDIAVKEDATVESKTGKVRLWSAYGEGAKGDVTIAGDVKANGASGEITVAAGMYEGSSGDIRVSGTVEATASAALMGRDGDVVIEKTGRLAVSGDDGRAYVTDTVAAGANGNVTVKGEVAASGKDAAAYVAQKGDGTGSVTVEGAVTADAIVGISATGGGIAIAEGAKLTATAEDGRISMFAARNETATGDVTLDGTLAASVIDAVTSVGDIRLGGRATAVDSLTFTAKRGGVTIDRDAAAVVTGSAGNIWLFSALGEGATGDIRIDGTVRADGENGRVAAIAAGYGTGTGDIRVGGNVSAGSEVLMGTPQGDIVIERGARLSASGKDGLVDLAAGSLENGRGDVRVAGTLTATGEGGSVVVGAASGKSAKGDVSVTGTLKADQVAVIASHGEGASGDVAMNGRIAAESSARVRAEHGDVALGGTVAVSGKNGLAEIVASSAAGATGDVTVDGSVVASGKNARAVVVSGYGAGAAGDIDVGGTVAAERGSVLLYAGMGKGATGDVTVDGTVTAAGNAAVVAGDGNVAVNGTVAGGDAVLWAQGTTAAGDVTFGTGGAVTAAGSADIVAGGSVVQDGTAVAVGNGKAESAALASSVTAGKVVLKVGADVGGGTESPLAVDGRVFAVVDGDASIAAAAGKDFQGGEQAAAPSVATVETVGQTVRGLTLEDKVVDVDGETKETISLSGVSVADLNVDGLRIDGLAADFSDLGENASLIAGGDLAVYTAGRLNHDGLFYAGGDITVSAASMGDMSFLRAGGTLHVNNVGTPAHPTLAYFETVNGVTPTVDNQPNDTVIFIDGRLAGGNIQTMNKLGSHEAFPVETPELKSVQGVFGNPNFLHGELDVSEPVGIGVIDYLLVDRARMSYGADIPPEMDMQVSVNGLSPLYSYWFGQRVAKRTEGERKSKKGVATAE